MTNPPVVATPLRIEQVALAGTLPGIPIRRTGMGSARTATRASRLAIDAGPLLVAGVAGGLAAGVEPGHVVVATEVRRGDAVHPCPSAALLAGALRRAGLPTHLGPVASTDRIVTGRRRTALAGSGALAVDMESGQLAELAGGHPFAVVRTVVDNPGHPLLDAGTPARALLALRALRATAPAIRQWTAATGSREILLAGPRSFCAGVSRAIEVVDRALQQHGPPVYVRRQIVHNAHVVRDLERRGAVFVEEIEQIPVGAVAVLAAHGVATAVHEHARERRLELIDATCPLVSKVHAEVRRHAARGDTVLLIGHRDHEEVQGTLGQVRSGVTVVEDVQQAASVSVPDPDRVAYAMQTTLAVDEAEQIADVLRGRFPALRAPRRDDICYATSNRQQAVRAIAADCDLVLVLGSGNSSNSLRLVEVAEREGTTAYLVDDAGEVDLRWLPGVRRIGITAGASAPPHLVQELQDCLAGLGPVRTTDVTVVDEDVRFALPREVN